MCIRIGQPLVRKPGNSFADSLAQKVSQLVLKIGAECAKIMKNAYINNKSTMNAKVNTAAFLGPMLHCKEYDEDVLLFALKEINVLAESRLLDPGILNETLVGHFLKLAYTYLQNGKVVELV